MPRKRKASTRVTKHVEQKDQEKKQAYFTPRTTSTAAPKLDSTIRPSTRQQTLTQIDFVKMRVPIFDDSDLLEEEPAIQSAPPKKRRRTIVADEIVSSTRSAPPKRRSLRLKHLPPDNVDTKIEESKENDTRNVSPTKLMLPPPKTPKKDHDRVIPSSQSPLATPWSLRSQRYLPSQIDSPLKERSVNIKTPQQLEKRKGLIGSRKRDLEIQDTYYENEGSDISTKPSLPIPSSSLSRRTSVRSKRDADLDDVNEHRSQKSLFAAPTRNAGTLSGGHEAGSGLIDNRAERSISESPQLASGRSSRSDSVSETELPSLNRLLGRSATGRRAALGSDQGSPTPIARQSRRRLLSSDPPITSSHTGSQNKVSSGEEGFDPADGTPTQLIGHPRFIKLNPPTYFGSSEYESSEPSQKLPLKSTVQSEQIHDTKNGNQLGTSRITNGQPLKAKSKIRQYGRRSRKSYESPFKPSEFLVSDTVEERIITDDTKTRTTEPNNDAGTESVIDHTGNPVHLDPPNNSDANSGEPSEPVEAEWDEDMNALPFMMESETQFQNAFRTFTPPPPLTGSERDVGQDVGVDIEENGDQDMNNQTTAPPHDEKELDEPASSPPLPPPRSIPASSAIHMQQERSQLLSPEFRPPYPPPIRHPVATTHSCAPSQAQKAKFTQTQRVAPSQATTADLTQSQRQETGTGSVPASQATTASLFSSPNLKRGKPKPIATQALLSSPGTPASLPLITPKDDPNTATNQNAPRRVRVKTEPMESMQNFTNAATEVDLEIEDSEGEEELEMELENSFGHEQELNAERENEESTMSSNLRLGAMFGFKLLTDSQLLPESIMNFRLPRIGSHGEILEGAAFEDDEIEE